MADSHAAGAHGSDVTRRDFLEYAAAGGAAIFGAAIAADLVLSMNPAKDVLAKLNQTLNAALAQPELKARLLKEGFEPLTMSPAQADTMLRKEMVRWAAQIKQAGITPE